MLSKPNSSADKRSFASHSLTSNLLKLKKKWVQLWWLNSAQSPSDNANSLILILYLFGTPLNLSDYKFSKGLALCNSRGIEPRDIYTTWQISSGQYEEGLWTGLHQYLSTGVCFWVLFHFVQGMVTTMKWIHSPEIHSLQLSPDG